MRITPASLENRIIIILYSKHQTTPPGGANLNISQTAKL